MKRLALDGLLLALFSALYVFVVDVDDTCKWHVEWMHGFCNSIGFGW